MRVLWHETAWEDYLLWQIQDRKMTKRINMLVKEIQRTPFRGIGKPEPLIGSLKGWWSRRIDESNRIVYKVEGNTVIIAACKGHYES